MAHDFLIYDFGTNEDTAQDARHKVESWAQGFRLGKKILLKFERAHPEGAEEESDGADKAAHEKGHTKKKQDGKGGKVHAIVRLDFSTHEKLSHQRWLDRIPTEEPFKSAKGKVVRSGHPEHRETSERFEALE
jgi:hypothetical protein